MTTYDTPTAGRTQPLLGVHPLVIPILLAGALFWAFASTRASLPQGIPIGTEEKAREVCEAVHGCAGTDVLVWPAGDSFQTRVMARWDGEPQMKAKLEAALRAVAPEALVSVESVNKAPLPQSKRK